MNCWPLDCLRGLGLKRLESIPSTTVANVVDGSHFLSAGSEQLQAVEDRAEMERQITESEADLDWYLHGGQVHGGEVASQQSAAPPEPLMVRAISGASVASLSPRSSEQAGALKVRIHKKEGTAIFMQKLVQGARVLKDTDIVSQDDPVVLVRMPRKRILIASLHSDLRSYDMDSGAAMRVIPAVQYGLSCMAVDWENARVFTGSSTGVVQIWDVYSNNILGTLRGLQKKVSAVVSNNKHVGEGSILLAACESGAFRIWTLQENSSQVTATKFHEVQTKVRGHMAVSVDWQRSLALVSGENEHWHSVVVAYDIDKRESLWSWRLPGMIAELVVDWETQQCIFAPRQQWLELRGIEVLAKKAPTQFAWERLDRKGLFSVDWPNALVIFVAKPFGLELWSLSTFEIVHRLNDASGVGADIVSLNVDWSQSVPRAITLRTYMNFETVQGEVCVQDWDMEDDGSIKNIYAEHPLVGGFDIIAAVAQF